MVATPAANRPQSKERRAMPQTVLIVGAGAGLSAAVARRFAKEGARVALAARHPDKLKRSEEHTSELQSLMRISYAVFCLKKKTITLNSHTTHLISQTTQHISCHRQT